MHAAVLIPSPASLLSSSFLCQPAPKPIVTQKTAQKFVRLSIDAQAERNLDTDVFGGVSRHAFVHQLAIAAAAAPLLHDTGALAVQSSVVAGRIPGLSEPDSDGIRTYKRPAGKSGGHGIGWSELIPYSFRVPENWDEIPVSIADLGGTEIDLRFTNPKAGNISVVVAPVLRFSSTIGDNAKIEDVGDPERVIYAFGPELTGGTVEGKVLDMEVTQKAGRNYYEYELDPHVLVSATAAGNRLYILTVTASGRQWKKFESDLRNIAESFFVG